MINILSFQMLHHIPKLLFHFLSPLESYSRTSESESLEVETRNQRLKIKTKLTLKHKKSMR